MAVLGATSLTGCNSIPDFIASGSRVIFEQSSAPTSWTKDVSTHNNKALRVVTGTATPGGSLAFTTAFGSREISGSVSVSGTVGGLTLSTSQIPSHAHPNGASANVTNTNAGPTGAASRTTSQATGNAGGGGSHDHPFGGSGTFSGSNLDMAVQYADVIICSKN
jgi:hypothetical protein